MEYAPTPSRVDELGRYLKCSFAICSLLIALVKQSMLILCTYVMKINEGNGSVDAGTKDTRMCNRAVVGRKERQIEHRIGSISVCQILSPSLGFNILKWYRSKWKGWGFTCVKDTNVLFTQGDFQLVFSPVLDTDSLGWVLLMQQCWSRLDYKTGIQPEKPGLGKHSLGD